MKVSIVTVVRDAASTIERTIESVLGQTHPRIEYLVVDGGSSDGTLDVIRRHEPRLARWISEPDRGIADAFNKGLALATGEAVGLANADDWLEPDQIARAVAALERSGADFVFGDLIYHAPDGRALHRIRGDADYARRVHAGMPDVNHPTMLVRRRVYDAIGGFDLAWRYAMDYDWLLRAHRAGHRGAYDPRIVGHMSLSGASDAGWAAALAEVRRVAVRHGQPAGAAWLCYAARLAKGAGRRSLQHLAPAPLHDALRRRVNRGFGPSASGS